MIHVLLLGCATAFAGANAQKGWQWHETTSPHFAVAHEMPWSPPGFVMNLEKMHNRLRMDLGMLSPWMSKERIKLYLYKDSESYLAGEFNPPHWSNGLALFELKVVAVPDNPDRKELMRVIGHEMTHILFESYWWEAKKRPAAWLNEGLAMMEESDAPGHPERSQWFQLMVLNPGTFLPLEEFFAITPAKDLHNPDIVADWYVQAYSIVYFLYRGHQRLQFKNFCSQLRDGRPLFESMWLAYRYHDAAALEKDWKRWLSQPENRTRAQKALAEARQESRTRREEKPAGSFSPMQGFKSLRE